ncbi:hypothetical protein IGI39_000341 [Enterococcus sp. AZ135]|uniref:hypothetical protein n=1 Tax=unclassified Enterococcus TaxID=2608891 RepID=UPI003F295F5A
MDKETVSQLKKETALKNFRYNRFLLLRYLLAGFFFTNLYWLLSLAMSKSIWALLPLGLIVLSVPAIAEHLRLYGYPSDDVRNQLKWHRLYQITQLITNVILLVSVLTNLGFEQAFPFFTNTVTSKGFVSCILLVGSLLSGVILKRIKSIYSQKDKHASYITEFSKLNN